MLNLALDISPLLPWVPGFWTGSSVPVCKKHSTGCGYSWWGNSSNFSRGDSGLWGSGLVLAKGKWHESWGLGVGNVWAALHRRESPISSRWRRVPADQAGESGKHVSWFGLLEFSSASSGVFVFLISASRLTLRHCPVQVTEAKQPRSLNGANYINFV